MRKKGDAQSDAEAGDEIDPRYVVPGLSRGLAMLQLFTREEPSQTLMDLANGLGVTRSAAYRLVYTLEKDGFIVRDPATRAYKLTARVLSLGFEYLNSLGLSDVATPILRRITERISAAAHLVVLDGWQVVYLARVAPSVALVSNLQVGTRLPVHLTASGRVLLAEEDEAGLMDIYRQIRRGDRMNASPSSFEALRSQAQEDRTRGYVYRASPLDRGLVTFACAVRDGTGKAIAAINVIGPEHVMGSFGGEDALKPLVLEAALSISREIGYRGP